MVTKVHLFDEFVSITFLRVDLLLTYSENIEISANDSLSGWVFESVSLKTITSFPGLGRMHIIEIVDEASTFLSAWKTEHRYISSIPLLTATPNSCK